MLAVAELAIAGQGDADSSWRGPQAPCGTLRRVPCQGAMGVGLAMAMRDQSMGDFSCRLICNAIASERGMCEGVGDSTEAGSWFEQI